MDVTVPEARLDTAFSELYAWYRSTEDMMGKVLRDALRSWGLSVS